MPINIPQNTNGQASSANSAPSVLSTEQEAKIDLLATKAKQDLLLAELELKASSEDLNNNSIIVTLLQEIISEQRITNKLLTKIYQ
jgi:hypothetical protein